MKLFLISQSNNGGYDTYDSAVVIAKDEEMARNTNPSSGTPIDWSEPDTSWASSPEFVTVVYLGKTPNKVPGVVLASFNAG